MTRLLCRTALAFVAVAVLAPLSISADIARPKEADAPHSQPLRNHKRATLVIESTDFNREVELVLPREMLDAGRAGAAGASITSGMTPMQTVIAGLALTFAIASGGVWLARSRRSLGARSTTAAVAIFATMAATAVFALANASPYADYDAKPGNLREARPQNGELKGEVRVLYESEDGAVHLVIPKKLYSEQ